MKKATALLLILMLSVSLLTGCGEVPLIPDAVEATEEDGVDRMEESPIIEYTVPRSIPSILVDQEGYLKDRFKIAIFLGTDVDPHFSLCRCDTDEVVYSGTLESKGEEEQTGRTLYYGDFTEYMEEGEYYVHHEQLGRSYSFSISEQVYHPLLVTLHSTLKDFLETEDTSEETSGGFMTGDPDRRSTADNCKVALTLLMAYELYPSVVEILNGNTSSSDSVPPVILQELLPIISFLSKMQDATTGGVCAGVLKRPSGKDFTYIKEEIDLEATAYYVAVMAGFGYLYQKYDYTIARGCLQGADRAWKYLSKHQAEAEEADYYMAAAQMYRTTGTYSYRKVVETAEKQLLERDMEGSFFYGSYFYLITKSKVNIDICSELTKKLMSDAEKIAGKIQSSRYTTQTGLEADGLDKMLQDMQIMVVVNYTIPNYEYATVIENQLHYLLGRNESAICLMAGEGSVSVKPADSVNIGADPMRIAQTCALITEVIGQMMEKITEH
ncbi:MAG: glycoside hydrolase family 9 protein [Lachnospiraceae bacterium]|nr:glycoside hydrolase family 9 protein [Lachnospiraceae bacterium]